MSFWIMLMITAVAGLIGGIVNYMLPANNPENGKYLKPLFNCIILGLGATLLVPLFLEIAQSKLLDNINFGLEWESSIDSSKLKPQTDTLIVTVYKDSSSKKILGRDTTASAKSNSTTGSKKTSENEKNNPGKNYLLWAAYCLLAAAAGFKFINMVINSVVKDQQVSKLKNENQDLKKDKEKREKNSQISQQLEDQNIRKELTTTALSNIRLSELNITDKEKITIPQLPQLPPIIHPEDPQKGRFGGKSINNERKLSAKVNESLVLGFYNVVLTVESINVSNPLIADVIFYLHDSFSPSVYTIKPDEFQDGKAVYDEILSYGAFTVGIITDNGKTMLELDLSEDKTFPKEFRER